MRVGELLAWQWAGYTQFHASRANLLVHIGAVPLFLAGNVIFVTGLLRLAPLLMVIGGIAMGTGLALQGKGHKLERVPPEPFTGPANAIARLLLEQWVTFPRFVLSGGWRRALKRSV
jgi:hypothetical protein